MAQGSSAVMVLRLLATGCVATGCVIGGATIGPDPSSSDSTTGGTPGSDGTGGSDPQVGGAGGGGGNAAYSWTTGGFSACSLPCGGGKRTRTVTCIDGKGVPAADGSCSDPKPAVAEACNAQSCSNIACTPVIQSLPPFSVSPAAMIAISPATGPGPLTVTLNQGILTNFPWDSIDFGDGTSFAPQDLVFQNLIGPNTGGAFACVNHTFIAPGTYSVGRTLAGGDPRFYPVHEVTVVVQ